MLWVICGFFLVLWLTFMATSSMMGGLAHLLLIAVIALVLFQVWYHRDRTGPDRDIGRSGPRGR